MTNKVHIKNGFVLLALAALVYTALCTDIPHKYTFKDSDNSVWIYIALMVTGLPLILEYFRPKINASIKMPKSRILAFILQASINKFLPVLSTISLFPIFKVIYYYYLTNSYEDVISFRFFSLNRVWSLKEKYELIDMFFLDPKNRSIEYAKYLTGDTSATIAETAQSKQEVYKMLKDFVQNKQLEIENAAQIKTSLVSKTDWSSYLNETTGLYLLYGIGLVVFVIGASIAFNYINAELASTKASFAKHEAELTTLRETATLHKTTLENFNEAVGKFAGNNIEFQLDILNRMKNVEKGLTYVKPLVEVMAKEFSISVTGVKINTEAFHTYVTLSKLWVKELKSRGIQEGKIVVPSLDNDL